MKEKFEIGYEVGLKKWFLQSWSKNRWNRGQVIVKDSCIRLNNVVCDTYSWADSHNELLSHGRFRFYSGNDIIIKQNDSIADSIHIKGKEKLEFKKYNVKKALLKYNISSMSWTILFDDKELETCDIKGVINVEAMEDPIRVILYDVEILYSWLVTLINCKLEISKI